MTLRINCSACTSAAFDIDPAKAVFLPLPEASSTYSIGQSKAELSWVYGVDITSSISGNDPCGTYDLTITDVTSGFPHALDPNVFNLVYSDPDRFSLETQITDPNLAGVYRLKLAISYTDYLATLTEREFAVEVLGCLSTVLTIDDTILKPVGSETKTLTHYIGSGQSEQVLQWTSSIV